MNKDQNVSSLKLRSVGERQAVYTQVNKVYKMFDSVKF